MEVVRGSNIEVGLVESTFREFLVNFKSVDISRRKEERREREERRSRGEDVSDDEMDDEEEDDDSVESVYVKELERLYRTSTPALHLDCIHLYNHSRASRRLYKWLVDYPQEIVHRMDEIATEVYKEVVGVVGGGEEEEEEER